MRTIRSAMLAATALTGIALAGTAWADANDSATTQKGDGNEAYVTQVGVSEESVVD